MINAATVPAPSESRKGEFVPGTIGFDLYLAVLRVDRAALKPAKTVSL